MEHVSGLRDLGEFRELVFNLRKYQMGAPSVQPHFRHEAPRPPPGLSAPAAPVVVAPIVATDDVHRIFLRYDRNADN